MGSIQSRTWHIGSDQCICGMKLVAWWQPVKIHQGLVNQDTDNNMSTGMGYVLPKSHIYHEKNTWSVVFSGIFITSNSLCKVQLPKINTLLLWLSSIFLPTLSGSFLLSFSWDQFLWTITEHPPYMIVLFAMGLLLLNILVGGDCLFSELCIWKWTETIRLTGLPISALYTDQIMSLFCSYPYAGIPHDPAYVPTYWKQALKQILERQCS